MTQLVKDAGGLDEAPIFDVFWRDFYKVLMLNENPSA